VPRRPSRAIALLTAAVLAAACTGDEAIDDGPSIGEDDAATVLDPTGPDPRGPIFDEFQASFSRDDPFSTLDAFCEPQGEPVRPVWGEAAITISVLVRAEDRDPPGGAPGVGRATRRLVDAVNDCGGLRGRPIRLHEVVVDLALRQGEAVGDVLVAACLEATLDLASTIVIDPIGLPEPLGRCIAVEQGVVLLTVGSPPTELLLAAAGRMVTLGPSMETAFEDLVDMLERRALLGNRTIGVVTTEDLAPSAIPALTATLAAAGRSPAAVAVIGCSGRPRCDDGIELAVETLAAARVDIVLPVLEAEVLADVLAAAATRGLAPQLYMSGVAGLGRRESPGLVVAEGPGAARIYDGSLLVDWRPPGDLFATDTRTAFDDLCLRVTGADGVAITDPARDRILAGCALVRLAARTLHRAGAGTAPGTPGTTRLAATLARVGEIDLPRMLPATVGPFKPTAVDVTHLLVVTWPCDEGLDEVCLVETDPYRPR
jgi:hypothetical protein